MLLLAVAVLAVGPSFPNFIPKLPNGTSVCTIRRRVPALPAVACGNVAGHAGLGHLNVDGSGPLNRFGTALFSFQFCELTRNRLSLNRCNAGSHFAMGGYKWSRSLCQKDSDGVMRASDRFLRLRNTLRVGTR